MALSTLIDSNMFLSTSILCREYMEYSIDKFLFYVSIFSYLDLFSFVYVSFLCK